MLTQDDMVREVQRVQQATAAPWRWRVLGNAAAMDLFCRQILEPALRGRSI
jgi:hypothetical protein